VRAALYYGPGDLRIEQVPEPRPAPDEVLLRPLHNGLCGTDLHQFYVASLSPTPLPIVVGHEFSAEVVEVGARAEGVAVGDLVTVDPLWTCGGCGPCRGGSQNLCETVLCHGLGAGGGGLAELTAVRARMLHRVPEGLGAVAAALVEPMSVAYRGVLLARPAPGGCAAVLGAGPIGIGCLLALRALGVDDVVVSEPVAGRRAVAAALGAALVLDPTASDVAAAVREHTRGAGVCVAIDAAGFAASFRTALAIAGRRGRLVTLAAYTEPVAYDPNDAMMRELEIVSSFSTCGEFRAVLEHMRAGRYPLDGWVERVPFERQLDAYDRLHRGAAMKVLVDVGA